MNTKQLSELRGRGFVALPYPRAMREGVVRAMESWRTFCSLPDAVKQSFGYSNDSAGVGYERKGLAGPSHDKKENFDITFGGVERLIRNHRSTNSDTAVAREFLSDAISVIMNLDQSVREFAGLVEETCGLRGFADEVLSRKDAYFVRFIHYFDHVPVGIETAEAHTDQSGFTLHLYESDRGLQYLDREKKWHDMPVSDGETVVIPSMQLQLRTEGVLKALAHRVISTEDTARDGRYSAVCFVQLDGPAYDKLRGRLQALHKQNLGFNYDMPHEEFVGLFKK